MAGHKLDIAFVDDTGNPSTAVAAAKQRIGQGYKIIADKYTFRWSSACHIVAVVAPAQATKTSSGLA